MIRLRAIQLIARSLIQKSNSKGKGVGNGVDDAITNTLVSSDSNQTKKERAKALADAKKARESKRRARKLSPQDRRLQKEFHDEIDSIALDLKKRRPDHNETIPSDILVNLSRRIGEPSAQSVLHIEGEYFASGLFWMDRNKMDIQDIRRHLRLSQTPKGAMYFENGTHYGLIHPFNESISKVVKYSLALSIVKLRNSGEIPSDVFDSSSETDLLETYFIRSEGVVYMVGIYNGSQLEQSLDIHFDEDETSIDEVVETISEPFREEAEDSDRTFKVKKHIISADVLKSGVITKARSEYSFEKRKRNVLIGFGVACLAIVIAFTLSVYGYIAYKNAEIKKQIEREAKQKAAQEAQRKAAENLRLDSIDALRFERTQLSNKDVYTPILEKSLQLAKSISFNKGLDKWLLDEWSCEVNRSKGMNDIYAVFKANCMVTYKGEALSEPESFREYEKLVRASLLNNAKASFEATKNYAVLNFEIPLGGVNKDYSVNLSDRFDAIRTLREMQSSLELKHIPLNFYDQGELEIDKTYRNQLLVESTSGGKVFPYGVVSWDLKAKINDLASEDMNVLFPPETYITQMTGDHRSIKINGVYHYE